MINKGILIMLLICGVIMVIIELVRVDNKCPEQRVLYRYIPRTFDEEQDEPVWVSDIFKSMFTQPSAWIRGMDDYDNRKKEKVNKYFINQI